MWIAILSEASCRRILIKIMKVGDMHRLFVNSNEINEQMMQRDQMEDRIGMPMG